MYLLLVSIGISYFGEYIPPATIEGVFGGHLTTFRVHTIPHPTHCHVLVAGITMKGRYQGVSLHILVTTLN